MSPTVPTRAASSGPPDRAGTLPGGLAFAFVLVAVLVAASYPTLAGGAVLGAAAAYAVRRLRALVAAHRRKAVVRRGETALDVSAAHRAN